MKPPPFEYRDPDTLDETLDVLAEAGDEAAIIAGGQSLVPLMNLRLARPSVVVDPRRVPQLDALSVDAMDGGLTAGAMVTATRLEEHPDTVPGMRESLRHLAHPQIRHRTTVGGTIAHADPAAELAALLVATQGQVTLASAARGDRTVAAEDFFIGPFWTARDPDELVTSVHFGGFAGQMTVLEVAPRPGDFATVGATVGLAAGDGAVSDARVVLFGVAGTPVRLRDVEDGLRGADTADDGALVAAGEAVRAGVEPTGDAHASGDYRRDVAGTLVTRALRGLATAGVTA